ncbi:MAG: hypothetical protein KDA52_09320 [Planctomycetaceae bacterium]|nr:hypothetical protein [Planctomycetaceae bacterium]
MLNLRALRELLFDPASLLFGVRLPHRRRMGQRRLHGEIVAPSLVELLECRTLLTQFVVTTADDAGDNTSLDSANSDIATETADGGGLSLREAILLANANGGTAGSQGEDDGDSIRFDSSLSNATISLTGGQLTITDDIDIAGTADGLPIVLNLTIDAQNTSRIFDINVGNSDGSVDAVDLSVLDLINGMADNGGAVRIADGDEVSFSLLNILNNTATDSGGGVFNGDGMLSIANTVISGNEAQGNAATDGGGGLYNNGGTVIIGTSGSNVLPADINGNQATGTSGSGGGIFSDGGTLTINDGSFLFPDNNQAIISGNTANRAGGGIEVTDTTVTLNNVLLNGNSAGVDIGAGATAAPGNGGGLHVSGAAMVTIVDGEVNENLAAAEGGGLWNQAGATMVIDDGTTIMSNVASGNADANSNGNGAADLQGGGGIFNNGGVLNVLNTNSPVTISNNIADGDSATGTGGSGGGIMSIGDMVTIDGATISMNEAIRAGGGIEIITGTLMLTDVALDMNDVSTSGNLANVAPGNGGGLHITADAVVTIDGGSASNNLAAAEGGGLWNSTTGTLTVQNGTVVDNNTASGTGSDQGGGGIFNNGDGSSAGGTLIIDGTLAPVEITNNSADMGSGSGGGIQTLGGTATIINALIQGNDAQRAGGGLEIEDSASVIITDSTIDMNDVAIGANPGNGGGIHVGPASNITVNTSTFTNNTASEGGGLWVGGGSTLNVYQSTVGEMGSPNDATGDGGGIYNTGGAMLFVDQSTIAYNTADNGGGIGQGISGSSTLTNSTISNNAADTDGGGIFTDANVFDLDSVTVFANTAANTGDGIEIEGGNVNIVNSIIGGTDSINTDGGAFTDTDSIVEEDDGDPMLGALADNGGPTFTHLPLPGSPAIDAGDTGLDVDQRGFDRPLGSQDDIGAVEAFGPAIIIDNGDPGFSVVGQWTARNNPVARDGDVHNSFQGDGSDVATWTFTGLTPGNYEVSATWQAFANRATNSPFTAFDGVGGPQLNTVSLNQQMAPDDFMDDGSDWEILYVVEITGDTLVVELSDLADGYVIADAIRIEQTADTAPVDATIIDDGDPGFVTVGPWNPSPLNLGRGNDLQNNLQGDGSDTATWTFTGLAAGTYSVAATWFAHPNRATDAPFSILDGTGGPSLAQVDVNQQQSPDDFTDLGSAWENLMTVTITGTELVVELSDDANGYVIADAIRIEPVLST